MSVVWLHFTGYFKKLGTNITCVSNTFQVYFSMNTNQVHFMFKCRKVHNKCTHFEPQIQWPYIQTHSNLFWNTCARHKYNQINISMMIIRLLSKYSFSRFRICHAVRIQLLTTVNEMVLLNVTLQVPIKEIPSSLHIQLSQMYVCVSGEFVCENNLMC